MTSAASDMTLMNTNSKTLARECQATTGSDDVRKQETDVALRVREHARQETNVSRDRANEEENVSRALTLLRQCVADCGYTNEALAAAMKLTKGYVNRVLNGTDDKRLTINFIVSLPEDVESMFEARRARQFGHIVVAPLHGQEAVEALVSGLLGVMNPQVSKLPEKSGGQLKAALPFGERRKEA